MHRDVAQWAMVRRKVLEEGLSRRQLARETGLSRNTIRKMLRHELPQPYGPRTPRHPSLRLHTATLDAFVALNDATPIRYRLSVSDIYRYLQREEGYSGSYGAVSNYLKFRLHPRRPSDRAFWTDLYDGIIALPRSEAIALLRMLSNGAEPLISATRARRIQCEIAGPAASESVTPAQARVRADIDWIHRVLRDEISSKSLKRLCRDLDSADILLSRLHDRSKRLRNRAISVLAYLRGVSDHTIASGLGMSRLTVRRCRRLFQAEGVEGLFARKGKAGAKVDDEELKSAVFALLHEPPASHGINRTTWTMSAMCDALAKQGKPACGAVVRAITKAAGYRWRKARVVLTSNDPDYTEKLAHIRSILSGLRPDEAFFSIDEFGPFSVKAKRGRILAAPGVEPQVPQWQKSKGCLILTAALELSGNQITHFYSAKKNTTEMIRMMDLLVDRYHDRSKLYLSWDAASWHVSKKLFERIDLNNDSVASSGGPIVATAPLPARAQFLNVIESVFSGMARAVIHNSDYGGVDEAKAAIDRHFEERNRHFQEHPRRAGKSIWGKEREPPEFSEGNNCKDPRYR
jgi:transposase